MVRNAARTVSLVAADATTVRGARRTGERVEVVDPDGRRLGVIVSAAELEALEAIEDARDLAEAREVLAAIAAGEEATVPWEVVRAELAALPS